VLVWFYAPGSARVSKRRRIIFAPSVSFTRGFSRVKEDQADRGNRFNGFPVTGETVKTVLIIDPISPPD
jgi:hypothetical protein